MRETCCPGQRELGKPDNVAPLSRPSFWQVLQELRETEFLAAILRLSDRTWLRLEDLFGLKHLSVPLPNGSTRRLSRAFSARPLLEPQTGAVGRGVERTGPRQSPLGRRSAFPRTYLAPRSRDSW